LFHDAQIARSATMNSRILAAGWDHRIDYRLASSV